jgi:hypothetical protein
MGISKKSFDRNIGYLQLLPEQFVCKIYIRCQFILSGHKNILKVMGSKAV